MKTIARIFAVSALAGAAAVASAADLSYSTVQNLGVLSSAGLSFSHIFSASGTFSDVYSFTMGPFDTATGSTTDTNWSLFVRDVSLTSVTLNAAGSSTNLVDLDPASSSFKFSGLTAGTVYQLTVSGSVGTGLLGTTGSYNGSITASNTQQVASAAPEPAELLLTALGLGGVAFWVRRQKRA